MNDSRDNSWDSDRRRHRRVTVVTDVTIRSASNFYVGEANDVSSGGLFVATSDLHPIGSIVIAEFLLPDDGLPIFVQCEVRWVRQANVATGVTPGMGLRFLNLHEEDQDRINAFIKVRDPIPQPQ